MMLRACMGMLAMAAAALGAAQDMRADTWRLETWDPPFDFTRPSRVIEYAPLERASRKWTICAAYPHLKDSYWLSVNYGMVDEAMQDALSELFGFLTTMFDNSQHLPFAAGKGMQGELPVKDWTWELYASVGSTFTENMFLRSWTNELYLWYSEVPDRDPTGSTTADYFNIQKTPAL